MRSRFVCIMILAMLPAVARAAEPVTGRWITDDGKAIVNHRSLRGDGVRPDHTHSGADAEGAADRRT